MINPSAPVPTGQALAISESGRGIRPSVPSDAFQIYALLNEVGLHTNARPEDLNWKYWQERGDWQFPRSYVLARDGQLLAHAGIVPGTCICRTDRIRTVHLIDWAARPGAGGAGVSLMKYIARSADAMLAIGGSAQTLQILPEIGFRPIGNVTQYVHPLRSLRLLRSADGSLWRRIPRVVRSTLWRIQAPRIRQSGTAISLLSDGQIDSLADLYPDAIINEAVFERSAPMLRYFLRCPTAPMQLFKYERAGSPLGYFLLAITPAQVRLVDCWTPSPAPEHWQQLIQSAIDQARKCPDAAELVTWASDEFSSKNLQACGFHARGYQTIQWLPRNSKTSPVRQIRAQMLDNDAAFYHSDRSALWS